jgi:hypothetical protein
LRTTVPAIAADGEMAGVEAIAVVACRVGIGVAIGIDARLATGVIARVVIEPVVVTDKRSAVSARIAIARPRPGP